MPRCLLPVLAWVVIVASASSQEIDARKYGWRGDYAAAKRDAQRSGKPLLVVFRCER